MSKLGTCRTGLFCRFDLHYNGHLQVCLSWGISGPLYISFRHISTFSVANSLANHPQRNGRSWVVTFQICQYSKAEWAELLHLELAPVHTAACLVRLAKALEMKRLGLGRIRKDSDFSKLKQLTQLIRPGAVKDHDVLINHRMKAKGNRGYKWYKSIVIFINFPLSTTLGPPFVKDLSILSPASWLDCLNRFWGIHWRCQASGPFQSMASFHSSDSSHLVT